MRAVITRVLPVPAPARTSSGPSVVVTASRWDGLRLARRAESAREARPGAEGEEERMVAKTASLHRGQVLNLCILAAMQRIKT